MSARYHLCHLNIGPAKGHIHSPVMKEFVDNMDEINNLAYQSPGFVWHLYVDIHNPEHLAMYGEPGLLFNMSVWESVEDLYNYVFHSRHTSFMKRRAEWFGRMDGPNYVLWWIPAGILPTLEDAKERIAYLKAHGPTPYAFDFKTAFSSPIPGEAEPLEIIQRPSSSSAS